MNTNKTKFTPGPWEACEVLNGIPHTEVRGENFGTLRAQFYGEDHRRNAVLCAAAPDLLAALESLRDCVQATNEATDSAMLKARAAIAKARGN